MIAALLAFPVIIAIIAFLFSYGLLSWGFVYMKTWNWFAVGIFSLPAITFVQALGASMIIGVLTARYINPKDFETKEEGNAWEKFSKQIAYFFLTPWITLLFAWITKLFLVA